MDAKHEEEWPKNAVVSEIIVTTVDKVRYGYM
jgi:hypothetical protein